MKQIRTYLTALVSALAVTVIVGSGALQRVDRWVQDSLYQHSSVTSRDIVIIGIDEDALDLLGPYNTWDRNIMASALEALSSDPEHLPAVTAVDVLYAGESFEQADQRLAAAAAKLGNMVTASLAQYGEEVTWENGHAVSLNSASLVGYEQPYEALRDVAFQGHINAMTDQDGVMRHALLYVEPNGEKVYSMAAQTARIFLEKHGSGLKEPPVSGSGYFYIPYTSRPGDYYDGVSIAMLIAGKVPPEYWADKIVLIGPYAPALQDAYFTPMDAGRQMYGVEIQANVIQSLLEGKFKKEIADFPQLAVLFLLCLFAVVLFLKLRVVYGAIVWAGMTAAGLVVPVLLYRVGFVTHPLWLAAALLVLYIFSLIAHYVRTLKERQALALEKERISAELSVASRIQANSLPKVFPPFPDRKEFDLYASMTPAKEVGGDLYDFFLLDEDHLGLVIGDVSGKGVPAALFMMVATSLIRVAAASEGSPAKVLQTVNAQICARNPEDMFVTVWFGILEISSGKLTAANAGHEYPALKKASGTFELYKDRHGFVIGGMEGTRYREYELALEKGDVLFVYTDGVPEASDAGENLFGTDRMIEALRSAGSDGPQDILQAVTGAVQTFVGEAPQFDDLTMLCLTYNGPQQGE